MTTISSDENNIDDDNDQASKFTWRPEDVVVDPPGYVDPDDMVIS
jgi:hypothetical protein